MPVCFQLTRIGDAVPANLSDVDRAICQNLDVPCDDTLHFAGWYDSIGLRLACGESFEQIAAGYQQVLVKYPNSELAINLLRVTHYLKENYTAECWREWK